MAHELDVIKTGVNAGKKAMFAVGGDVWHDENNSVAIDSAPTLDEALTLGGLNFEVALRPLSTNVMTVDGKSQTVRHLEVPEHRAVVRLDRNEVLGVVGPAYTSLQNADAFRVLEPLLDAGLAKLETGGTLRGGRDVWMLVRFNIEAENVRATLGDEVIPYGLISNNHNGARQVTLQETPVRVVCANTLGFALQNLTKAVRVRHTTNVKSRTVDAAAQLFANITERYTVIAKQYDALKATILSEELFARLVLDVVAPLPELAKKERADNIATAAHERATERAAAKRRRLAQLWTEGDGHKGDHSAWEAYNAATQSIDHDAGLWKVGNRIEALFDGSLAKTKQDVVESLVGFAQEVR